MTNYEEQRRVLAPGCRSLKVNYWSRHKFKGEGMGINDLSFEHFVGS